MTKGRCCGKGLNMPRRPDGGLPPPPRPPPPWSFSASSSSEDEAASAVAKRLLPPPALNEDSAEPDGRIPPLPAAVEGLCGRGKKISDEEGFQNVWKSSNYLPNPDRLFGPELLGSCNVTSAYLISRPILSR